MRKLKQNTLACHVRLDIVLEAKHSGHDDLKDEVSALLFMRCGVVYMKSVRSLLFYCPKLPRPIRDLSDRDWCGSSIYVVARVVARGLPVVVVVASLSFCIETRGVSARTRR